MTSWLTVHYAPPEPDTIAWHIYLQDKHKGAVDGIAIGDSVFFYEYKVNKPVIGEPSRPPGAQGIVRIATVNGSLYPRDVELDYTDGTSKDWSWGVPVSDVDTHGFVPLKKVLKVLGYKPGSTLRGFNSGTGVMRLTEEQARTLQHLFGAGR